MKVVNIYDFQKYNGLLLFSLSKYIQCIHLKILLNKPKKTSFTQFNSKAII